MERANQLATWREPNGSCKRHLPTGKTILIGAGVFFASLLLQRACQSFRRRAEVRGVCLIGRNVIEHRGEGRR